MKLISWNVNGIRAIHKKGLFDFINREAPDILCLQETKAHPEQLEKELLEPLGRKVYWSAAQRRGYSGVATFLVNDVPEATTTIGLSECDVEGRFVITKHRDFTLYNIYFPNGAASGERHDLKQRFLQYLNAHLAPQLKRGDPIVVVGDYNVAHREIDIYDPTRLAQTSGFLPEERAWFDQFLEMGFVDTFRLLHPHEAHRYTWWSYQERARLGNRGWRIDYICVSQNLADKVKRAEILDEIEGSDHCPVLVELEL